MYFVLIVHINKDIFVLLLIKISSIANCFGKLAINNSLSPYYSK